jgi:hypothetical protein
MENENRTELKDIAGSGFILLRNKKGEVVRDESGNPVVRTIMMNRSKEVVANSDSTLFHTHAVKKIQECKGFQEAQEALALNRRLKEMVAEKQTANKIQANTQENNQEFNQ